ncbi:hypothetical protein BATDEDRAFT_92374 [Batrachochytrium dendrobatidis JAM81]|uniref:UspA domain-containing protein n=1 Tax=Batrachochytrium dendrobatidis (strain JAM81 / FGSC 10211) TaxID=684364 RepID=F4PDP3_BATDJ|nr:uncharacterized protein BATDEDRAFT_92374 [Batrachochytrium dendrobatidis JAM81]EGF76713.1 hypothetical protein BATDEDRAFT_92374 [Batrachochytrium dendrobatidis JAM81]KAK5666811.1 hypothetical protein QVD99_006448 [Batrachochytrium dendrobatidis]|eukprot:XP_006682695.1 hypothetical protein BATDEDRAFT_92374 [Batrachochytrium dendrobatidis JAM81]
MTDTTQLPVLDSLSYTTVGDQVVVHRNLPQGSRHLMVAVDLSNYSFEAVKFTFENVARQNDVVSVVQIIRPLEGSHGKSETPSDKRTDAMISLHDQVKKIRNDLGKQVIPFRVDVGWGDARKIVLEMLDVHKATILIVGSRGRTSLQGALLGSVSQYLLSNAKIPVIVVRNPKEN